MNITITSAPIEIEPKLTLYIESKLVKLAKKSSIVDSGNEAHVEISKETGHQVKLIEYIP
jgi:ribosome-associated translation inhibitor RaiA